jgi:hypothetical protein
VMWQRSGALQSVKQLASRFLKNKKNVPFMIENGS